MIVIADEMMPLSKAYDAVVDDVKNARFVEHLENILVFGPWLEPKKRHGFHSVPNNQFHDRLLCTLRGEEEHHHFWDDALLERGANRAAKNGSASVLWMNRDQPPTPSVKVVNGSMRWLFRVQARAKDVDGRRRAQDASNGRMSVSKHG